MNLDHPLSSEFLTEFPEDAARILEQISVEHVAALFETMPEQMSLVISAMLPGRVAACMEQVPDVLAAKLFTAIPASSAARVYRLMSQVKQQAVSLNLSTQVANKIQRFMDFSLASAGAILNSRVEMLAQSLTVAEAIRHLEHPRHIVSGDIYIVDELHKLVGSISPGVLLIANHHSRLKEIMNRKTQSISVHAMKDALMTHPAWNKRLRLPVVDRDNTLLGELEYSTLKQSLGEIKSLSDSDPIDTALSLFSLFWFSIGQLLDSLLSIADTKKGDEK